MPNYAQNQKWPVPALVLECPPCPPPPPPLSLFLFLISRDGLSVAGWPCLVILQPHHQQTRQGQRSQELHLL